MKGKVIIVGVILISLGFATLTVFGQNNDYQSDYVERTYEAGNFSKNFNRLPKKELREKVLTFDVGGVYKEGTTQTTLSEAEIISDIISNYPTKVTTVKTGIEVSDGMNSQSAIGSGEQLTTEQKALLNSASLGDELVLTINFNAVNVITGKSEERELRIGFTVIPEIEAVYAEGKEALVTYLQEYSDSIIPEEIKKEFEFAYVEFVVNETGGIEDVHVKVTTNYDDIDKQLMDFISAMSDWKPAQNAQGEFVKQRFEFSISTNENGC